MHRPYAFIRVEGTTEEPDLLAERVVSTMHNLGYNAESIECGYAEVDVQAKLALAFNHYTREYGLTTRDEIARAYARYVESRDYSTLAEITTFQAVGL